MATNQNSNKEEGTQKAGTKRTTTRSSTGTRSTTGTARTSTSGEVKSEEAKTKSAETKAAGTSTSAPKTTAGRRTSSTARTSVGNGSKSAPEKVVPETKTRTSTRTSKTAASESGKVAPKSTAAKTGTTKTAAKSTAEAKTAPARKTAAPKTSSGTAQKTAAASTVATVATSKASKASAESASVASQKTSVDLFSDTPYSSGLDTGNAPKTSSPKKSTFNDDVADYLGSGRTTSDTAEKTVESSSKTSSSVDTGASYSSSPKSSSEYGYYGSSHDNESSQPEESLEDKTYSTNSDYDSGIKNSDEAEKKEKKNKALPIVFISAGVVLMAGIGVAVASNGKSGDEATKVLNEISRESATQRENILSLANQYIENGDFDQAIMILSSYTAENPGDAEAQSLLDKARNLRAASDNLDSPDDILKTFNSRISSGDYDGAANYVSQKSDEELAEQGLDGNDLIHKAMTLSNGRDLLNQGEYSQADTLLDNYLKNRGRDSDVENMLAQVRRLQALADQSLPSVGEVSDKKDLSYSGDNSDGMGTVNSNGDLASLFDRDNRGNQSSPSTNVYRPSGNNSTSGTSNSGSTSERSDNGSASGNTLSTSSGNNNALASNNQSGSVGREPAVSVLNPSSSSSRGESLSDPYTSSASANTSTRPSSGATGSSSSVGSSTAPATNGSTATRPATVTTGSASSGNSATVPSASTSAPSTSASANTSTRPSSGTVLDKYASPSEALSANIANPGSDGTKTSPEVLLKKYGTRAISRGDALDVGRSFIDDKKYDECINLMRELLTLNAGDMEARKLLEEAQALKKKYGVNTGRTPDQNMDLAERWINNGNYNDAITMLESILKNDPNNQRAKDLLAKAKDLKNGRDPAKVAAERADKLSQALKLMNEGKYDEAMALLNQLLADNPDDVQAKNLLNQVDKKKEQQKADNAEKITKARDALNKGDVDQAIALLEEILKNDPNNAEAKNLLAQAKAKKAQEEKARQAMLDEAKKSMTNGNPDDAIAALEKYLKDNPNDAEAKKLLDQAKKAKAENDAKINQAKKDISSGDYDKAIAALEDILKRDPNNAEAKRLLEEAKAKKEAANKAKAEQAKKDMSSGNYDKAIAALEDILKNDPNNAEAKKLLEEAKAKKKAAEDAMSVNQKIDQAKKDISSGNYDKAIAALEDILKNDPNNAEAKKLLEEAKAKKDAANKAKTDQAKKDIASGNYDKAIAALEDVLKNDPSNAEAKRLLEEAKAKKKTAEDAAANKAKVDQAKKDIASGNYDKAIAALEDVLKNDPSNAEAKRLLEEAKAKKKAAEDAAANKAKLDQAKKDIASGNYDKAIAALEDVLKNDPSNAEAKRLLEEAKAKKKTAEDAAANKAKVDQAKKDIASGNYDKAIAALEDVLKNDPNNAEAKRLLEEAKAKKKTAEDAAANKAKLDQAKKDIASGNYDKAIAALEDVLKNDPNNAEAKRLLSEAQTKKAAADKDRANKLAKARSDIDNGNYDSAITAMNGLLKTNPNDADAKKLLDEATAKKNAAAKDRQDKLAQAQKLIDAGDYEGAQAILNGLIGANGSDSQAKNLLNKANAGKAAADAKAAEEAKKADLAALKQKIDNEISQGKASIAKGNANDALSHFKTAKDLLPKDEPSYSAQKLGDMAKTLYDAAQNAGDATTKAALNNAASQYAAEAAALDPNNAPSHYVLGMQALDAKNYAKAEEELNKAVKQDPTNGIYWYQLGRVQALQKKYTVATTSFQNAIKYEPTLASAYYNLGYVQERNGNQGAALEAYKQAYSVDTKYERAYIAAGRLMSNAGDYNGAVTAFGNAIKVNPSNAQTYQEQGAAYANLGDYKSAESAFRRALTYMDQSKPDAATYYNLSSVLSAQNKNSEGVNYAATAYNNRSSVSKALQVNIIYNYGLLSEKTGETKRAISLYEEALSLDSTHIKSKINLGGLYLETGDVESAITFLNSAYAKEPNNFEVNNNLGNAYRQKGDYAKAVTYYQNALKLNATDNTVRENLAKAYASSGQYSNAKMAYEDVIAANPDNWSAYLEAAKIDMSLGDNKAAVEKLEYLQVHNPSYARSEVSTLLYSLR